MHWSAAVCLLHGALAATKAPGLQTVIGGILVIIACHMTGCRVAVPTVTIAMSS